MAELEKDYASHTVLSFMKEKLLMQKTELEQKLAVIAFRFAEIHNQLELGRLPITVKVRTAYSEYRDDGYVGGFSDYDQRTLIINASYFETAYLGALAKQATKIGSDDVVEKGKRSIFMDHSSIYLEQIAVGEGAEKERPLDEVANEFNASREAAYLVIASLREKAEENNAYKDIPIRVNQSELLDALLRREILKYCEANDPHFSIHEVDMGY